MTEQDRYTELYETWCRVDLINLIIKLEAERETEMMQLTLTINTNAFPEYDKHQLNEMLGLLPLWVAEHVGNDDSTDIVQFMTDRYGFGKLYKFEGGIDKEDTIYLARR